MNREDIIRMAREAGFPEAILELSPTAFERFAELVASAEREEWERKYARLQSLMVIRETQPNKPCCLAEREACIKIVEDEAYQYASPVWAFEIVNDIKARGQA